MKDKMTFNDFKAYRAIWVEVIKLNKWRNRKMDRSLMIGFMNAILLTIVGAGLVGLLVRGACLLIVAMPHAWLAVR